MSRINKVLKYLIKKKSVNVTSSGLFFIRTEIFMTALVIDDDFLTDFDQDEDLHEWGGKHERLKLFEFFNVFSQLKDSFHMFHLHKVILILWTSVKPYLICHCPSVAILSLSKACLVQPLPNNFFL